MRAMLGLLNAWDPILHTDLHVTDGAELREDLSVEVEPGDGWDLELGRTGHALRDDVLARLQGKGFHALPFYPEFVRADDPASGLAAEVRSPRYSLSYWATRNRFGALVETHFWQEYPRRVAATRETIHAMVELAARDGAKWLAAARRGDEAVMYQIGDMWAKNQLGIADEHVASNIANTLVKMSNSKYTDMPTKKKIVICVPEGEEHNLGANILETHLASIGHRVYNLTPTEPHDSIASFIGSTKPDSVIVSIILEVNINPGQRLVKKILDRFDVPIYIGGQAINDDNVRFEYAQIIRDTSLKNIARLVTSKK